jgi:tetratricopeptide (TPR) repeat protein/tRNA A-37 threonylcarbamoyl transferase component Bud32
MDDPSRPAFVSDDLSTAAEAGTSVQSVDALLDLQSGYWAGGEPRSVEAILELRPGLRDSPELVLDLIYHEVLLRQRWGDSPRLDEYVARFPHLADALRTQFEVHHALQPGAKSVATISSPYQSPLPYPAVPGYEVLAELGRGGMGVVYKARDCALNRLVALKMLRAEALTGGPQLARFRSEAEVMARLEHPNIVRVYEVGEHEGRPYFAMELISDDSLEKHLGGVPQPPHRSARLLETLARAVHAAHTRRLVHRDLKPANVLLAGAEATDDPWALPKITDFGLAKRLDDTRPDTRSGDILGTPCYMAPEQAYGRNDSVGPRTDIWALGAILYEMLTGRPPFRGETVWDTLQQVGRQEPVPPRRLQPKVPRDLETICLKCLQKEPGRRYASALALADDLGLFLAGQPINARPLPWWEQALRFVRARPTVSACLLLALVLVAGHYVHLQAELTRARRDTTLAEVRELLGRVDTAAAAGQWKNAESLLHDVALAGLERGMVDFPGERQLADLRAEADRLQRQITPGLTHRENLATLAECRADAGFFATPFAGLDVRANRERTRLAAERGLRPFIDDAGRLSEPDGRWYSKEEARSIREGCCEVLLDLAAVTLESGADETPDDQRQNAAEALRLLDRAAACGVDTAVLHDRRAPCLARLNRADEAATERELARAPLQRPFEHFLCGNDRFRAGDVKGAAELYEQALATEPDHFAARYALGVCHVRLASGRAAEHRAGLLVAQVHFTHCISRKPERVWPYIQRGLCRGEIEDFAAAEADFARARELLTHAADNTALYALLVNRGLIRVRRKNLDGAVADLERAVALRPAEWQAYVNLAAAYTEQGRTREAGAQLDRAVALRPAQGLPAIHRNRARLRQAGGDPAAAAAELMKAAAAEQRENVVARAADYLQSAKLLEKAGRHADAVTAADECLHLAPDSAAAHRVRAEALLQLERYADAVAALCRYLECAPNSEPLPTAEVYRALGMARAHLGDAASAADDFTRALGLNPDDPTALVGRGWAYVVLDANSLAERDFDRAVNLDPDDAGALLGRGYVRVKAGSMTDGLRDAETALRANRGDAEFLYNAARVFARAARRAESDPTRQGPTAREERARLEARALHLLGLALQAMPAQERTGFWHRQVERDEALNLLRRTENYRQMAGTFARPDSPAAQR